MKAKKKIRFLRTGSILRRGDEFLAFDNRWHRCSRHAIGTKVSENQVCRRPLA